MSENRWSKEYGNCFGCGENPWGLDLSFNPAGDSGVTAEIQLDENYQGFRDVAHGGIVATMLDEAAVWAVNRRVGRLQPSFQLDCRFKNPVPLGKTLQVRGEVEDVRHGVAISRTEVLNEEEKVLARAQVKTKLLSGEASANRDNDGAEK